MPYIEGQLDVNMGDARGAGCCRAYTGFLRRCPSEPFRMMDKFLYQAKTVGFSGIQNLPTVDLIDGNFCANLEDTGMSYQLEVDLVNRARDKDMFTSPHMFWAADTTAMATVGADIIICHSG